MLALRSRDKSELPWDDSDAIDRVLYKYLYQEERYEQTHSKSVRPAVFRNALTTARMKSCKNVAE
jgi:hypothetical protein